MEITRQDEDEVYEASQTGCVESLIALIRKNPLVLRKLSLTDRTETPLHISALLGHLEFTKTLLTCNPKFAERLDSFRRTPLHLASAEGHKETVQALVSAYADACFCPDEKGKIPLHYAAMRGEVEVLKELTSAHRGSIYVRVENESKETVLHLCVKYNQLKCLKLLVELARDDNGEFLNSKAGCDAAMTILHLALMLGQIQTIRYLLSFPVIRAEANSVNVVALNMFDVIKQSSIDFRSLEIQQILMDAGIETRKNENDEQPLLSEVEISPHDYPPVKNTTVKKGQMARLWEKLKACLKYKGDWLQDIRGDLMLVATMISTMTFQAAVNPPGGVWQDFSTNKKVEGIEFCSKDKVCYAGKAVLGSMHYEYGFKIFTTTNTVAFLASLTVTLLVVSGFPLKNRLCMWLLSMAMCATLVFTALAYLFALGLVLPDDLMPTFDTVAPLWLYIWFTLLVLIALCYVIRSTAWLMTKLKYLWCKYTHKKTKCLRVAQRDARHQPILWRISFVVSRERLQYLLQDPCALFLVLETAIPITRPLCAISCSGLCVKNNELEHQL